MKLTIATSGIILLTVVVNLAALTIAQGLRQLRLLQPLPTVGWNK